MIPYHNHPQCQQQHFPFRFLLERAPQARWSGSGYSTCIGFFACPLFDSLCALECVSHFFSSREQAKVGSCRLGLQLHASRQKLRLSKLLLCRHGGKRRQTHDERGAIVHLESSFTVFVNSRDKIGRKQTMVRRRGPPKLQQGYAGWPIAERIPPTSVDTVDPGISPEVFWKDYISQRKPVRV